MIIRHGQIAADPRSPRHEELLGPLDQVMLSSAGGITQFGLFHETLHPGARSSDRHWHTHEDELAFVLDGTVTLHDNHGMHDLAAGDAVAWPHGEPNAHRLVNRTDAPCSYLIMGTRVARDTCTYPDDARSLVNGDATWQIVADDGKVLRGGDLPPELLNLPRVWGTAFAGASATRIMRALNRAWVSEGTFTHPAIGAQLGPYAHSTLGNAGGLSQFGVHLERLPPGSQSSFRHWHETEDEMIHVLSGSLVLNEGTEAPLGPGDTVCWPAGRPVGHCLENRSGSDAVYLTVGTRFNHDRVHYPDHDLITTVDGPRRSYHRADGTLISQRTVP